MSPTALHRWSAGTLAALNCEPDVAWSERTRRTAVLVASPRLGRLSLAAWYSWCGGQGEPVISKFSILRRTVTSVFRTSEKLLHCLFVFVALRMLSSFIRHSMDLSATPFAMHARASRSNSNRCAARRSAASTRSSFFYFFIFYFFIEACFAQHPTLTPGAGSKTAVGRSIYRDRKPSQHVTVGLA